MPLPSAAMVWAMACGAMLWLPKQGARRHVVWAEAHAARKGQRLPCATMVWALAGGAVLGRRSMAQGPVFSWPKPTPSARTSVIVGADASAAVHRDGVRDGTRACCPLPFAAAPSPVLWWSKPTPPVWGSAIVGADAAAAVCRDGLDDGARRRFVSAEADATRVGQRHCRCGRGCCRSPRCAAMAWALARGAVLGGRSPTQGPVFSWPKPTPPVRASVIVGADVAAAVRRDGVGVAKRHCVGQRPLVRA